MVPVPPFPALSDMHPALLLLLRRVCVIENMTLHDLARVVGRHHQTGMAVDQALGVFCASYFAQAATLQGHDAARHRGGETTVKNISAALNVNNKRYDLSLNIANDGTISEDREPWR